MFERGYTVREVAERLGVSEASLYSWKKAVVPNQEDDRGAELLEAKRPAMIPKRLSRHRPHYRNGLAFGGT